MAEINCEKCKNPLLNNCVLQHMFQYLNASELKQMRMVQSVWNAEASLWLKERTTVSIYYKPFGISSENYRKIIFKNNVEAFKETRNFPVANLKLTSLKQTSDNLSNKNCFSDEQTLIEITTIFQNMQRNLKFLHIELGPFCFESSELLANILNAPSVQKLSKLSFNTILVENALTLWKTFETTHELKNLETLEIIMENDTFNDNEELYSIISEKLLKLSPNLSTISVQRVHFEFDKKEDPKTFQTNTLIYKVLGKLKDQKNLKQVLLPLQKTIGDLTTDQNQSYFLPINHLISKKLTGRLTRLEIALPSVRTDAELMSIQKMFDHHAPTLVEFRFTIPCILVPRSQRYDYKGPVISLPIFPKLKILSVKHQDPIFAELYERPPRSPTFGISIKFLSDKPNYKIQFPMLIELSLGQIEHCCMDLFYENFFPCAAIFYGVKRVSWMHEVYVDDGKLIDPTEEYYLYNSLLYNIEKYLDDAKECVQTELNIFHQQLAEWTVKNKYIPLCQRRK